MRLISKIYLLMVMKLCGKIFNKIFLNKHFEYILNRRKFLFFKFGKLI